MLFHSWPFLIFLLVVLPVFYALRRTPLWIPWLLAASYFFYGWWNPYYLLLVVYSTALDYLLVTLMDHCPPAERLGLATRTARCCIEDRLCRFSGLSLALGAGAVCGPPSLRATCAAFAILVSLMALGAWLSSRRLWLFISIFNNLALLLFFKYARFVEQNLNQVLAWLHAPGRLPDPATLMPHGFEYILPVGISFFTFQSMSYTIDFYLGTSRARAKHPALRHLRLLFSATHGRPDRAGAPDAPAIPAGASLSGWSISPTAFRFSSWDSSKKSRLANYLALYVDRVYDNPAAFNAAALALATFAFAWQIFFDFSGYTDMARGVAKMMGFNLILNFNNPYLAAGLGEFWSRWHISLSTWFRDYLYIPLGGNRHGTFYTYRNLFIVFLVSGIWHGSAWTFAIWGLLHAVGIMLTRELERSAFYRERVPLLLKQCGVFLYVCFAWIFFRSSTLSDALLIVSRIFTSVMAARHKCRRSWCSLWSRSGFTNGFTHPASAMS